MKPRGSYGERRRDQDDAIEQHLPPEVLDSALQSLTHALDHVDGGMVLRIDEADYLVLLPDREGVVQGGPCSFGSIALSHHRRARVPASSKPGQPSGSEKP